MEYRREIDGLRAIAVLPVILFHAGFDTFAGGYIGVDVFFVISGYLITSIILAEKKSGRFTLAGFYERRARRILPALFVIMFASLLAAPFSMWPGDLDDFAASMQSVVVFSSNIYFWLQSGYFDATGELRPLLHTWSLAVEEQYYVLFPLFLTLIWKANKQWVLCFIALISLGLAEWASTYRPSAAFFLLPTRGWEILLGALAALQLFERDSPKLPTRLPEAAGWIGLAAIVYSVFWFDGNTPFPSFYALIPTLGTALIIVFSRANTTVGRILGNPLLVGIGLISYSAYLWHQPLFAFARHWSVGELPMAAYILLIAAVFPLSLATWKYVELPFRDRSIFSRRRIFTFAAVGSILFLAVGFMVRAHLDWLGRKLPDNLEWESFGYKLKKAGDICDPSPVPSYEGTRACYFGDTSSDTTVGLYGDSHALALSHALHAEFLRRGIKGVQVFTEGCRPIPTLFERRQMSSPLVENCTRSFESTLRFLKANVSATIVSNRWTFDLYPIEGAIEELNFDNREGGIERNTYQEMQAIGSEGMSSSAESKTAAINDFIKDLLSSSQRLILIGPVPEVGWDIAKYNYNYQLFNGGELPATISTNHALFQQRNRYIISVLRDYENTDRIDVIWPEQIFCNTYIPGRCAAQVDRKPLYYDDDHLSDAGASIVVERISDKLW